VFNVTEPQGLQTEAEGGKEQARQKHMTKRDLTDCQGRRILKSKKINVSIEPGDVPDHQAGRSSKKSR